MRDQRGVAYVLAVGIGMILVMGAVYWMLDHAIDDISGFSENELHENSRARQSGDVKKAIWTALPIITILVVVAWMIMRSQRGSGAV